MAVKRMGGGPYVGVFGGKGHLSDSEMEELERIMKGSQGGDMNWTIKRWLQKKNPRMSEGDAAKQAGQYLQKYIKTKKYQKEQGQQQQGREWDKPVTGPGQERQPPPQITPQPVERPPTGRDAYRPQPEQPQQQPRGGAGMINKGAPGLYEQYQQGQQQPGQPFPGTPYTPMPSPRDRPPQQWPIQPPQQGQPPQMGFPGQPGGQQQPSPYQPQPVPPQTGGFGQEQFQQLTGQFQQAQQEANRANEQRYQQGLGIYGDIAEMYKPGGGFGQGMESQLQRTKTRDVAAAKQQLAGAGLYNTTVAAGQGQAWEDVVGTPARLQMQDIQTGRYAEAMRGKAGFIERRTDQAPDMGQFGDLMKGAYAGPGAAPKQTYQPGQQQGKKKAAARPQRIMSEQPRQGQTKPTQQIGLAKRRNKLPV